MKLHKKSFLTLCLLLVTMLLISGCAGEKTPYEINDRDNYNVSVKFDANGGLFTTNTSVIVDSFNISNLQTNDAGQVEIALISPDDQQRGKDGFKAYKNGHFLAGWYAERTSGANTDGETVYTYSNKWDFGADKVKVAADGSYSSSEPVLTLYAVWVPMFEIELYDLSSGEYLDAISFDPNVSNEFDLPVWNQDTGCIDMNDFPARDGYTFNGLYLDAQGTQSVADATIKHTGYVNDENGTATDSTMKLYVDWTAGEWFHIYTAEQFVKNAKLNGHYVIHADLDFSEEIWPTTLMHGSFTGTIQGNGHSFSNVSAVQTNNSKTNSGLFGQIKADAQICDLTLDNATFTIGKGARVSGACFGLLAGQLDSGANLSGLKIINSALKVDSNCAFLSEDYSIGLVCGSGDVSEIDASGIVCAPTGEEPETLDLVVDGTSVRVNRVSE